LAELYKALGGLPGILGFVTGAVGLFYRFKVPGIAVDYLQRELERYRSELTVSDADRRSLRAEVKEAKAQNTRLEDDFTGCLKDRERCRHHIRQLERQLRAAGHEPVVGEEERS
jgi:septal ring factor EnvC (AmiA/AmiB activator)